VNQSSSSISPPATKLKTLKGVEALYTVVPPNPTNEPSSGTARVGAAFQNQRTEIRKQLPAGHRTLKLTTIDVMTIITNATQFYNYTHLLRSRERKKQIQKWGEKKKREPK